MTVRLATSQDPGGGDSDGKPTGRQDWLKDDFLSSDFLCSDFWSSNGQTDRQKAMDMSPPCICTGVLKNYCMENIPGMVRDQS